MDLQHIRELVVLSQHRSFRSAAKALFISQPTLGKHVGALEAELGCRLVDREPVMRLTPAGRYFVDRATTLVEHVDEELADIASQTRSLADNLVELAIPDFSRTIPGYAELVLRAKALFEHEHAPARIDVNSVNIFDPSAFDQTSSLEEVLDAGGVDWMVHIASPSVGERAVAERFGARGLEVFRMAGSVCRLVVESGHPLASARHVTVDDLGRYPFLCNRFPVCYYASYDEAIVDELRACGIESPMERPCQKSSPLNSWGGGQRLGDCIAPVPELAFGFLGFYDQNRNVVLDVEGFEMRFDFYCVYRAQPADTVKAAFIDMLRGLA